MTVPLRCRRIGVCHGRRPCFPPTWSVYAESSLHMLSYGKSTMPHTVSCERRAVAGDPTSTLQTVLYQSLRANADVKLPKTHLGASYEGPLRAVLEARFNAVGATG